MGLLEKLFGPQNKDKAPELDEDEYIVEEDIDIDDDEAVVVDDEDEEVGQLALDVFEDEDKVIVQSTIAGVKPEDLDISVSSDSVTIKGQRRKEYKVEEEDYFYQECYWGGFARRLPLPVEVDVDKVSAEIKDGVLTVAMPKLISEKTKKVKVKSEG